MWVWVAPVCSSRLIMGRGWCLVWTGWGLDGLRWCTGPQRHRNRYRGVRSDTCDRRPDQHRDRYRGVRSDTCDRRPDQDRNRHRGVPMNSGTPECRARGPAQHRVPAARGSLRSPLAFPWPPFGRPRNPPARFRKRMRAGSSESRRLSPASRRRRARAANRTASAAAGAKRKSLRGRTRGTRRSIPSEPVGEDLRPQGGRRCGTIVHGNSAVLFAVAEAVAVAEAATQKTTAPIPPQKSTTNSRVNRRTPAIASLPT
jgi:hypothetical protein